MYQRSIEDPSGFWSEIASEFYWKKKWGEKACSENFDVRKGSIHIEVGSFFTSFVYAGLVFFEVVFEEILFAWILSSSGSKAASQTYATMHWIEISKLEMVRKLLFIGKEMNQVMMGT